jgi:hypothetical protein
VTGHRACASLRWHSSRKSNRRPHRLTGKRILRTRTRPIKQCGIHWYLHTSATLIRH